MVVANAQHTKNLPGRKRYGILFWSPGERFDYSNLGYGILGEVVAHASGKSYAEFLTMKFSSHWA